MKKLCTANQHMLGYTLRCLKSSTVLIMIFVLIAISVNGQQSTLDTSLGSRASTVYDGVTWEKYVNYLQLDGSFGLKLPIKDLKLEENLQYTIMLWFKPMSSDWQQKYSYAFQFQNSLSCYFTPSASIMCDSIQKCDKLEVSLDSVKSHQWIHLTIGGHETFGSYLQIAQNNQEIGYNERSYVILQQIKKSWNICLGGCEDQYGFVGGFRDFIFINRYVERLQAIKLKNHYLLWDTDFIAYYRFKESNFFQDEYQEQIASYRSPNTTKSALMARDYIPNDICYPITQTQLFHGFSNKGFDIKTMQVDDRWQPERFGWAYSVTMTVYIDQNSCSTSSPTVAQNSCHLVYLGDSFMIFQPSPNTISLYLFNSKTFFELQSDPITIPQNQWLNIQLTSTQFNGFQIVVYDILGREIGNVEQDRNLQVQNVKDKQLSIFKGFQGFVKNIAVFTSSKILPFEMPEANSTNVLTNQENCLAYFKIQPDSIYYKPGQVNPQLVNLCKDKTYKFMNATMNVEFNTQSQYYKSYDKNLLNTDGLTSTDQQLFDGIACNDGSTIPTIATKNSYIKASTNPITQNLSSSTVEFWFNVQSSIQNTNYLFSLWSSTQVKEYMSIFYDSSQTLDCAPFGFDSVKSPILQYPNYTQSTYQNNNWFHISCAFKQLNTSAIQMFGTLYNTNSDYYYEGHSNGVSIIPNDTYDVYIGNNKYQEKGSQGLMIKELRLWGAVRSTNDIKNWRYRQIEPYNFVKNSILTYIRLNEGNYREVNYATIATINTTTNITFSDITYGQGSGLVICPVGTFYYEQNMRCYQNPIKQTVAAVYPYINGTRFYWVFDASNTQIIDNALRSSIKVSWVFEDKVLQNVIKGFNVTNQTKLYLPSQLFKDESYYPVSLNLSNAEMTFYQLYDFLFIPVDCHYIVVNDNTAYDFYNNYTAPQSSGDITFSLGVKYKNTYCSDALFFNYLLESISYQIVPALNDIPKLKFTISSDRSKITVTIPQTEQYKMPTQTDVKIIFTLKWTNDQYKTKFDNQTIFKDQNVIFQNTIYTINFRSSGKTVVPSLKVKKNGHFYKDENVTLDAGDTYITSMNYSQRLQNLTFSWICPTIFTSICLNQNSTTLNISTSDFQKVNASYQRNYTFTVNITWNNYTDTDKIVPVYYNGSVTIVWYNAMTPNFTIIQPQLVKSTAEEQKFYVQFLEKENPNSYTFDWYIVPNLTLPVVPTTDNNGQELYVDKGGFSILTNYSMTLCIKNKNYPSLIRYKNIKFTTSQPPYGGKVNISPLEGIIYDTTFKISLSNWQSSNLPILYRVWATSDSDGNNFDRMLSNNWLYFDKNFSFIAINPYPIMVEISDASGEVTWYKLNLQLDYNYTGKIGNVVFGLYQNISNVTTEKYQQYKSLAVELAQNTTEVAMNIKEYIVDEIKSDIANFKISNYYQKGDAIIVMRQSIVIVKILATKGAKMTKEMVTDLTQILKEIQYSEIFDEVIEVSKDLKNELLSSLGQLIQIAKALKSDIMNKIGRGLDSQEQDQLQDIQDIIDQVLDLKTQLISTLCELSSVNSGIQEIDTDFFTIQIEKISSKASKGTINLATKSNPNEKAIINVKDLMTDALSNDPNMESLCYEATFYKINMMSENQPNISQYSQSLIEFAVVGMPLLNTQQYVTLQFAIGQNAFDTNQSSCMAFENSTKLWQESYCETQIDYINYEIKCQCSMINSLFFGIFSDNTKIKGTKLQKINTYSYSNSTQNVSYAFFSVILVLIIFAFVLPIISYNLDKRDSQLSQEHLKTSSRKLYEKISKISGHPLTYWQNKQDIVLSYSIKTNYTFFQVFNQQHSIISIFTKYDTQLNRMTRNYAFLIQLSIFTLICAIVFGGQDNTQITHLDLIDNQDINEIIGIGILGMILLLPFNYSCLKSKEAQIQDNLIQDQQVNDDTNKGQLTPHAVTDQCILPTSPHIIKNIKISPQKLSSKIVSPQKKGKQSIIIDKKENNYLNIVVMLFSYILCLCAMVMTSYFTSTMAVKVQYCIISAFFIGLIGSIIISNTIYIATQCMLLSVIRKNPQLQCFSLFISNDSLKIYQERKWVQEAIEELIKEENNELLKNQKLWNAAPNNSGFLNKCNVVSDKIDYTINSNEHSITEGSNFKPTNQKRISPIKV